MKLIDKLLRKCGYMKIPPVTPVIEKEEYKLEMVRMEYEINPFEVMGCHNPSLALAAREEVALREFLLKLAPFAEKRVYRQTSFIANQADVQRCELRIMVARPKPTDVDKFIRKD